MGRWRINIQTFGNLYVSNMLVAIVVVVKRQIGECERPCAEVHSDHVSGRAPLVAVVAVEFEMIAW